MKRLQRFAQWQASEGQPVQVGEMMVTPLAQTLVVRLPFGGFVWNRPLAVLVERDGRRQRIPIVDATRLAQLAVLGLGVVFVASGVKFLKGGSTGPGVTKQSVKRET